MKYTLSLLYKRYALINDSMHERVWKWSGSLNQSPAPSILFSVIFW